MNGIVTLASGQPFTITSAGDAANVGGRNISIRANLVGDPTPPSGFDMVDEFFNTDAFTKSILYTFGNVGRNTMTGPSHMDWDMRPINRFVIAEKVTAQFRMEAFNFTNTPTFGFLETRPERQLLAKSQALGPKESFSLR